MGVPRRSLALAAVAVFLMLAAYLLARLSPAVGTAPPTPEQVAPVRSAPADAKPVLDVSTRALATSPTDRVTAPAPRRDESPPGGVIARARRISVRVIDAGDSRPVVGARVVTEFDRPNIDCEPAHPNTGPDGVAMFRAKFSGGLRIHVHADDYLPHFAEVTGLESPEESVDRTVRLASGLAVAGTVRWNDGTRAGGAVVGIEGRRWFDVPDQSLWVSERTATADGRFRIVGLAPGYVTLRAELSASDGTYAAIYRTEAGSDDAELRLGATPERRPIRLRVVDPRGAPVEVFKAQSISSRNPAILTDGFLYRGEEWSGTPAVSHRWIFVQPVDGVLGPTLVGDLGSIAGDVVVTLPWAGAIEGLVTDERGEPIVDAVLVASPRVDGVTILDGAWDVPLSFARSRADGTFRIAGLGRFEHSVVAESQGYENGERVVPALASHVEIRLRSRPNASVSGVVRDSLGAPLGHAWVYASDEASSAGPRHWRTSASADALGRFEINGLRPGHVVLRASAGAVVDDGPSVRDVTRSTGSCGVLLVAERGVDLEVRVDGWDDDMSIAEAVFVRGERRLEHASVVRGGARFLRLDPRAEGTVWVGPLPDGRVGRRDGVRATDGVVDVRLVRGLSIRGRVVVPVEGATIDVGIPGTPIAWSALDDGRFLLPTVPVGRHRVRARALAVHLADRSWEGAVEVSAGDQDVVITLEERSPK